jgi:cell division protein DivIC
MEETKTSEKPKKKALWLKGLKNKYVLISLFFIIWMLFFDDYAYINHRVLNKEITTLEKNRDYYLNEIKQDEKQIQLLKNPDYIEKYAREQYFMKRENEDIFIIDVKETEENEEISKTF